ncbi:MAG: hypothetical protein ACRDA3_06695 [Peptostreptococcaceae bacterium]
MNSNTENRIMNNKKIESNAKMALDQYKLEIGNELNDFNKDEVPYLGGLATKKLVEMGEELLLNKYNNKNK